MTNLLQKLASTQPKVGNTLFIAVDGHGGSGKTSLAQLLAVKLNAEVIHTDDFASWDNPLHWHPLVIRDVFEPIMRGAQILSYQPTSWWEDHHPARVSNQRVTPFMILEGVSSSRKDFDEYLAYRIFVDTPKEICIERGIARDMSTGKTREELAVIWEQWFENEEGFMQSDNPKEKADLIIDGTRPFEDQISF